MKKEDKMQNTYLKEAEKLLNEQIKDCTGKDVGVIAPRTKEVLLELAAKEPEFAQAIAQCDHTFKECCEQILNSIERKDCSDFAVFGAAAQFYFPGCKVSFTMVLDLVGTAAEEDKTMTLDLGDFC